VVVVAVMVVVVMAVVVVLVCGGGGGGGDAKLRRSGGREVYLAALVRSPKHHQTQALGRTQKGTVNRDCSSCYARPGRERDKGAAHCAPEGTSTNTRYNPRDQWDEHSSAGRCGPLPMTA
jgi:hypothetical protein